MHSFVVVLINQYKGGEIEAVLGYQGSKAKSVPGNLKPIKPKIKPGK